MSLYSKELLGGIFQTQARLSKVFYEELCASSLRLC